MNYQIQPITPFIMAAMTLAYPPDHLPLNAKHETGTAYEAVTIALNTDTNYKDCADFFDFVEHVSTETLFREFSKKWKEETEADSSLTRITSNLNYLKVISLGTPVIPFILRDLQEEAAPWFVALSVLTNKEDIGKDATGNFRKIADAWISWGQESGYI